MKTLAILSLAALTLSATAAFAGAPDPVKARNCRGEMAKMVAMGLIQHANKDDATTMTISLDAAKWGVMPGEMKLAVGRTIGCVLAEGAPLADSPTVVKFRNVVDAKPIAEMAGDTLTIY